MGKKLTDKQLATLRKYAVKPGQVLNPHGRRGGDVVRSALLDFLQQPHGGRDYSRLHALIYAVYGKALRGDVQAAKLLLSYAEPPPTATSQATVDRDELGRIVITWGAAACTEAPAADAIDIESVQDALLDQHEGHDACT